MQWRQANCLQATQCGQQPGPLVLGAGSRPGPHHDGRIRAEGHTEGTVCPGMALRREISKSCMLKQYYTQVPVTLKEEELHVPRLFIHEPKGYFFDNVGESYY